MIKLPATSTVHALLYRHGLVTHRKRCGYKPKGTLLQHVKQPNQLWCADDKAEFKPGHQQQNGRHERMHRTLNNETTKPATFNFPQQQERFDHFIEVNHQRRAHQALGGKYPGQLYTPSSSSYLSPEEPDYSYHGRTVLMTIEGGSASSIGK